MLLRNESDGIIGGVLAGLADYTGIDVSILRVLMVLAAVFGIGAPVLIYIIMWMVIPE